MSMGDTASTRFAILGPLRVNDDRGHEVNTGPPQQKQLLALLLLSANECVPIDEMIDMLWPAGAPGSAANTVHRHLGRIRHQLNIRFGSKSAGPRLMRDGRMYWLSLDELDLDISCFRRLTHTAQLAAGPEARFVALNKALSLWRGRCAAGLQLTGRVELAISALEREFIDVVTSAADAALELKCAVKVLSPLEQAIRADPWNEILRARMIAVLGATGRTHEALISYVNYREELAREMGVDPGSELSSAFQAVLDSTVNSFAPPPVNAGSNNLPLDSSPGGDNAPTVVVVVRLDKSMSASAGLLTANVNAAVV
jgi:DNA-binding SARP family transcriptional activator